MKKIDRFDLIDRIGRELQSRMRYKDIDVYLTGFGIDCNGGTSEINSKWVYAKELLADADESIIIEIADELGIDHGFTLRPTAHTVDSKYWTPGFFRVFLSHLSGFKAKTAALKNALKRCLARYYAMSAGYHLPTVSRADAHP